MNIKFSDAFTNFTHKLYRARMQRQRKSLRWNPALISPDDTFIVSYPRSGNTWMRYLLANLLMPGEEWNITNIGRVVPDIHEELPKNMAEVERRVLKSHKPYQSDYPRVIYLYRDGRDVCISYYDFIKKLKGYEGSFETYLNEWLEGKFPYGNWRDHVSSWLFENQCSALLQIRYEDLYENAVKELKRIRNFLGSGWDEFLIESAVAKSSLGKFRKDYYKYKRQSHWDKKFTGGIQCGPGNWRNVFDDKQNDMFWRRCGDIAEQLGYERF
jgi:hypothetical protein